MSFNRYTLILFLLATAMVFTSCRKDDGFMDTDGNVQEVTFNPAVSVNGNKSAHEVSGVNYCYIEIDTMVFRPATYVLNGKIYTQSIKLTPGSYTLNKFLMMNDNGTPDDYSDDVIILATPMAGSDYAAFVNQPAGFSFAVGHLRKSNVDIEVVLFTPSDYDKFGFDFDVLPATTIREQRFTGLILPKNPADYANSLYMNQSTGLQNEMPAIFSIDVFRNGRFVKSVTNEDQLGETYVSVTYPDGDNTVDEYRFDLNVYLRTGLTFGYKHIKTWEFVDDEMIPAEPDSLVHFVLSECGSTGSDLEIGPYMNLPESCNFTIKPGWAPGSLGAYFDGDLGDIPIGNSIGNGLYSAWCGTDSVSININHTYQMDVYNSLTPSVLPAYTRDASRWNAINWLFNNLSNYSSPSWGEIQGAVWKILNDWDGISHTNVPNADGITDAMVSDALSHIDFKPECGQKAAAVLVPKGTNRDAISPKLQVVFIMVNI